MAQTQTKPRSTIFINRSFTLLLAGDVISLIGDAILFVSVGLWVAYTLSKGQSWGPLIISGVTIMGILPRIFIRPLAGVFVDRWNQRKTMMMTDSARTVLILALAILAALPTSFFGTANSYLYIIIIGLCIASFLESLCGQFFYPSRTSMMKDIIPESQLQGAYSLLQLSNAASLIIGPPIGVLLYNLGPQFAFGADAASFLLSFLFILYIRNTAPHQHTNISQTETISQSFRNGLKYFTGNSILMSLLIILSIATLGSDMLNPLLVFFTRDNLHASPQFYGYMLITAGIGGIAGAIVTPIVSKRFSEKNVLVWTLIIGGALTLCIAGSMSKYLVIIFIFFTIFFITFFDVAANVLMMKVTDKAFIGRTTSIMNPIISVAGLAASSLAGFLASVVFYGAHVSIGVISLNNISLVYTISSILFIVSGIYTYFSLRLPAPNTATQENITPTTETTLA